MAIYKKKFVSQYFGVNVQADNKEILELIANQLDFPPGFKGRPLFNISLRIMQNDAPLQKAYLNFIYTNWELDEGRLSSSLGLRLADVKINPSRSSAQIKYHSSWQLRREFFLDFIFFQPIRVILAHRHFFFLHAAALEMDDKCVFLFGHSGCGKSTLSLTLAKGGLRFLCDDDCFIGIDKGRFRIMPLRTKMGIKEQVIQRWPHFKKDIVENFTFGGKKRITLKDGYAPMEQKDYSRRIIIFPRYDAKAKTRVLPVSQKDGFKKIANDNLMVLSKTAKNLLADNFWILYEFAQKSSFYELVYNDQGLDKVYPLISRI